MKYRSQVCVKSFEMFRGSQFSDALTELHFGEGTVIDRISKTHHAKAKQFNISSSILLLEVTCLHKTYFANNIGNSDP